MGNYNPGQPSDQYGFRVIEVKPGSPAEKCGLKVSTDYIVSINEQNLIDLETPQIINLVNVSLILIFITDPSILMN